jgi:hypothetical protein
VPSQSSATAIQGIYSGLHAKISQWNTPGVPLLSDFWFLENDDPYVFGLFGLL